MFYRLAELAELLPERASWELASEGMPENYNRGLAVCFDDSGCFDAIKPHRQSDLVVYRGGPPNGNNLTPCRKLVTAAKSIPRLRQDTEGILPAVKDAGRQAWLERVLDVWGKSEADIVAAAERAISAAQSDKDHRVYLFTAALSSQGRIAPLYGWEEVKASLVEAALASFGGGSSGQGVCYICNERRQVLGDFSVLACYNRDKPGAIAGGFDARRAWRNFPICVDCALPLANAINYTQQHFCSRSAGVSYFALPDAATETARQELRTTLEKAPQRFTIGHARDLLAEERDLIGWLEAQSDTAIRDQLGLQLLFFVQEKASWRLKAEVRQVLPSRIRLIHQAVEQLAKDSLLASYAPAKRKGGLGEIKQLRLSTYTLKRFAGEPGKASERILCQWLAALFGGQRIERRPFVRQLVAMVLATYRKEATYGPARVREAWAVYRFAVHCGLIEGGKQMALTTPASPYGEYCRRHPEFFASAEAVAAFLVGCFCSVVAATQRRERGAAPFANKFQGRQLDPRVLRRLYAEGRDKLAQYDKLGLVLKDLDPDVAQAFVSVGDRWQLPNDELTFAFCIGLSLQYRIQDQARQTATSDESRAATAATH